MPCRDGGPDPYEEQKMRLDKVTRLLCELCKKVEESLSGKSSQFFSHELIDWWIEHQRQDRLREEFEAAQRRQEQLRDSGLNKLTLEERQALGLY